MSDGMNDCCSVGPKSCPDLKSQASWKRVEAEAVGAVYNAAKSHSCMMGWPGCVQRLAASN